MTPEDFDLFATMLKQRSGLVLTREKAYLLESRLLPVVRKYNLRSLEEMAQAIRDKRDEGLMSAVTEAMTTTESFFFRDRKPFNQFRNVILPKLLHSRANKRVIRIWSAAASSGQEAYSIAMICAEAAVELEGWKIEILGTDISKVMIERAMSGIYSHFEVQRGLSAAMLVKYFQQIGPDKWQISENIRKMVQFKVGNLLFDFGPIGAFDVVFCRNVVLYFDVQTKKRVLEAIANIMPADGLLLLGGGETVTGVTQKFRPVESADPSLFVVAAGTDAAA